LLLLLTDTPERRRQLEAFVRLDTIMEIGGESPSDRAAAVVLDIVGQKGAPARETPASALPSV
jgi:lipid-A-disaccharide synthase